MRARTLFAIAIVSLYVIFVTSFVNAQVPQLLNYQGKLVKADGIAEEGTFAMVFSIYSTETGGTALWTETQNDVKVINGVFKAFLGSVSAFPNTLFAGSGDRYLDIKVGNEAEMTPRFRLTSVPYAQRPGEADNVADYTITNTKLTNSAVTNSKIMENAVTSFKIMNNTITGSDISSSAILQVAGLYAYVSNQKQRAYIGQNTYGRGLFAVTNGDGANKAGA